MTLKEEHRERLARCLTEDAAGELEDYLLASSGLPGPRGNLELAHALADLLAREPPGPAVRERLEVSFRVLRQGLGYALSVLVAAEPARGFALLERWAKRTATHRDPDIDWVLRENLKKKRLARYPEQARRMSALLGGS